MGRPVTPPFFSAICRQKQRKKYIYIKQGHKAIIRNLNVTTSEILFEKCWWP